MATNEKYDLDSVSGLLKKKLKRYGSNGTGESSFVSSLLVLV